MRGLYIHLPFCEKKCFYCSFVVVIGQESKVDDYLKCLEIESSLRERDTIDSVYFGGGTPSLLNIRQLDTMFRWLKSSYRLSDNCEITLEANPEGLTFEKSRRLKALGITRMSLGIQTFNDSYLKELGRIHSAETALKSFEILRSAGFDNINVDLMFSFPRQTLEDLKRDVAELMSLQSEHVSLYSLSVEPRSRFYAKKISLQTESAQAEQYLYIIETLQTNGWEQYEISNFARAEEYSRHNLNTWRGGNYIGLGVGAHSHNEGRRFWNADRLQTYLKDCVNQKLPQAGEEVLTKEQRLNERLLFGLRMNAGINLCDMTQELGCCLTKPQQNEIDCLLEAGLLQQSGKQLRVTNEGRLVLDEISARLI